MPKTIPPEFADKYDYVRKEVTERLLADHRAVQKRVGKRPYAGKELSAADKMAQYGRIRKDPAAWAQLIRRVGKRNENGTLLLPKELLAQTREFERELGQGLL
jgi:hypothetical protein